MGSPLPGGGRILTRLTPPGPEFAELFRTFEHTAFRLELRDTYNSPSEQEPLRRFRETGVVDQSNRSAWLGLVAESTRAGRTWRRVRVVTLPLTEYSDWGLRLAEATVAAGDDIRYLERDDAVGLPDFDYWLFDSRKVAKMHFDEGDGRFIGFEIIEDPSVVVELNYQRDAAWHHAITRDDFAAEHLD
ncbi:hypothetical protein GCM10027059_46280 [Myceligenerans halotolerans]